MSSPKKNNPLAQKQLIVSVKEARKLLGAKASDLTTDEIEALVKDYEVLARLAVREHLVRK